MGINLQYFAHVIFREFCPGYVFDVRRFTVVVRNYLATCLLILATMTKNVHKKGLNSTNDTKQSLATILVTTLVVEHLSPFMG